MSVTVPREAMDREVAQAKAEYVARFGEDAASDVLRAVTLPEQVAKLVRDLEFWQARSPALEQLDTEAARARYGLCLLASDNLMEMARRLDVEREVLRLRGAAA